MKIGTAKQSYAADQALFTTGTQRAWLGVLAVVLLAFPLLANQYWALVAVLVMANIIGTTGLNILTGFTGQVSLGHAAFMAVGAYAAGVADLRLGTPAALNLVLGGLLAAALGVVVGVPSLRIKGLYLTISTLATSMIVHFALINWASVTNGPRGLNLPTPTLFGFELDTPAKLYWLAMPFCVLLVLAAANLFRTRIGRAFIAIRDRDISAAVLGIPLLRFKLYSFALSSFYAGVAGGIWAYLFRAISPESFPLVMSVFFLAAVIVGGAGSILGGILGAIFMTMVPEALKLGAAALHPWWPDAAVYLSPVRTLVFGLLIVGFLLLEPMGLAEIWRRLRRHFALWPFRT